MSYLIPEDADYACIREQLWRRVDADRGAAGCGQPWPCGTVRGILGQE